MSNIERPYIVQSDAISGQALEFASIEQQRDKLVLSSTTDLKDEVRTVLQDVPNWLPMASEVYNISANINDYIMVPTISMPSDLPNRNQIGFPFSELSKFQHEFGALMYKTWNGMPTFLEHANSDHTKAKGIILNTIMRPIKGSSGNIFKVIKLSAWDRNADPLLASELLSGKRRCFSIGAYSKDYKCNICNARVTKGGCEHVELGRPNFRLFNKEGKQVSPGTPGAKLAYLNVSDAKGFELSSVASPAYISSSETNYFTMNDVK